MENINQKGIVSWIILALILISIIGIGVGVYLTKSYTRFLPKAANDLINGQASLSLNPASINVNKGCEFKLDINVNTGGASTIGTDAVVKYDPALVTALSVENGTFYPTYPGNVVDNTAGKVLVSGISSASGSVNGQGLLASVKFMANSEATSSAARIYFDFDPQNPTKTNDSNIVESTNATEILKEVTDAVVTLGTGSSCSVSATATPTSSANPTPIEITAAIESTGKAIVNFQNIPSPNRLDKLELLQVQSNTTKKLIGFVYTANCSDQEPDQSLQPKNNGTCKITLPDLEGEYIFRLYQSSAESNPIQKAVITETNLLKNPSMENLVNNYPTDWLRRSGSYSDTSTAKSGTKSLKVVGASSFSFSTQNVNLLPNTLYTASVWVKTLNVSKKGAGIRYTQLSPTVTILGQVLDIQDAFDWKRIQFTFTTPQTYQSGKLDLTWQLSSDTTIWFDDASLCKGAAPCL